jgi:hypothetical protein
MSAGAEGGAAPRYDGEWVPAAEPDLPDFDFAAGATPDTELRETRRGRPILAAFLILMAIAWLGACALVIYRTWDSASLVSVVSWVATICVPLALIILLWIAFGRTARAETERFTRAVTQMKSEADSLERVLIIIGERLTANRTRIGEEAARLMGLGEEASDRLGRVTHYLSREAEGLNARSQAIEAAASQARVDLGVLLSDLPKAEESARGFSETVREAGVTAHERALALEAQLSAITARAQDVDAAAGGAAERLGAHIARIETSAGAAAERLDEAAARLDLTVDAALGRTGEAVAATRTAIDAQAEGVFALVEQCRARLSETGADAGEQAARALEDARRLVETISDGIAAQEQASGQLVGRLTSQIASLDERLTTLSQRAEGQTSQMATALADLRDATATLRQEVDASTQEAVALVQRTGEVASALDQVGARLREDLPPALAEVEARADAMRSSVHATIEPVQALQAAAADGVKKLGAAEQQVARSREALEALMAGIDSSVAHVQARLTEIAAATTQADDAASVLVRETGPELVEALVRVREAARAAASHAREAIAAVIPESAAKLAEAAQQAVGDSVTASVQQQMAELESGAQRASAAARKASERLTRQLLSLGQNAAALEARIEEEKTQREEQEHDAMPRRVALLIESLNSTAIDVTKLLSNDVTDPAWQAYLKGDRGVFTRRAVRLLTTGEAREIQRHYDQEPEFRTQVNRYIGDFEAMLRRILSDSDGNALAVTLLSSDMGKLYVALAQAIQHLRV